MNFWWGMRVRFGFLVMGFDCLILMEVSFGGMGIWLSMLGCEVNFG